MLAPSHRRAAVDHLVRDLYDTLSEDYAVVAEKDATQRQEQARLNRASEDLRAAWAALDQERARLEVDKKCFAEACSSAWATAVTGGGASATDGFGNAAGHRIRFNIGGQYFETTVGVLMREPSSVFAGLVTGETECKADGDGSFYFDRDWMLFRLVLQYLRDGEAAIPADRATLKALHKEAGFWKLHLLRAAIKSRYEESAAASPPQSNHLHSLLSTALAPPAAVPAAPAPAAYTQPQIQFGLSYPMAPGSFPMASAWNPSQSLALTSTNTSSWNYK